MIKLNYIRFLLKLEYLPGSIVVLNSLNFSLYTRHIRGCHKNGGGSRKLQI